MDKQTLIEKVKAMAVAKSCCPELRRAVQAYLVALGRPNEKIAAQNLIAATEENIMPIDKLVTFARSARAIQILGKESAKKLLSHVNELYASGAQYCDCKACTPAAVILQNKEILLAEEKPKENVPDKKTLLEKLKAIEESPSCHADLRKAIKVYFDALGTNEEKVVAQELIDELKDCVVKIESLLIFAHSNSAIEMFGVEKAKIFAANADALKAKGAKYCNCRACTLGIEVLEHKDILLA